MASEEKRILLKPGGVSIIGEREYQQDAMFFDWIGDVYLALICDGMGGMQGGELASKLAVQTIVQSFRQAETADAAEIPALFRDAFQRADEEVHALKDGEGKPMRSGTTVVAAAFSRDGKFCCGSVGDSVIYLMRRGNIMTVNRMHNYQLHLEKLYRRGEITAEKLKAEGKRGEALISFLGIGGLPLCDVSARPQQMEPGDILLLASDGLYKSLNSRQIQAITEESGGNMQIAAERLCREALRLSVMKQDNTTVIAIGCERG